MARVPQIDERVTSGKVILNAETAGLTPEQFDRLCRDNRDLRLELTARKEIVIMAPAHSKTGSQELEIARQLANWTEQDGSGIAFGSNAGFTLPNGAVRAPDASWMRLDKWNTLTNAQQNSFAPAVPDFVIELRSHTNTAAELQEKMVEYIENGAQLGWLVDPSERKVYVYRPGRTPEILENPASISGQSVLPGFVLDLTKIW